MGKVAIAVFLFIVVGLVFIGLSKWKEPSIIVQGLIVTSMLLIILKESGHIEALVNTATKVINGG